MPSIDRSEIYEAGEAENEENMDAVAPPATDFGLDDASYFMGDNIDRWIPTQPDGTCSLFIFNTPPPGGSLPLSEWPSNSCRTPSGVASALPPVHSSSAYGSTIPSQSNAAEHQPLGPHFTAAEHGSSVNDVPILYAHQPPMEARYELLCQSVMAFLALGRMDPETFVHAFTNYCSDVDAAPLQERYLDATFHPSMTNNAMGMDPASYVLDCKPQHNALIRSVATGIVDIHESIPATEDNTIAGPSNIFHGAGTRNVHDPETMHGPSSEVRRCCVCGKTGTSQWRLHPITKTSLCNGCGQKAYRHDRGKGKEQKKSE
ncbi:hypothetical protein R3P38DRAFT_892792 [Favolaschia claudopus]|uniref:GATA-type domain-containing protein n=1 Tax=Favolaschia claudopus TaxID=2862362 RepID=A0AAW0BXU7_9AGAR